MITGADQFGLEGLEESSDEDSEKEMSSDDESDARQSKRIKGKKKRRVHIKDAKIESRAPPSQSASRTVSKDKEVEKLIQELNQMSMGERDPVRYGAAYFRLSKMDPTGVALQCVQPPQVAFTPLKKDPPPASNMQSMRRPPATFPNNVPLGTGRRTSPTEGPDTEFRCYGCGGSGHSMRECPDLLQLKDQGIITQDPQSRRFYMANGSPIYKRYDETIGDAARRLAPSASSNAYWTFRPIIPERKKPRCIRF